MKKAKTKVIRPVKFAKSYDTNVSRTVRRLSNEELASYANTYSYGYAAKREISRRSAKKLKKNPVD
jgi:hypothetical protein